MASKARPDQYFIDRFHSQIEKTDSCWLWTGSVSAQDYGHFWARYEGEQFYKAHRYSYRIHHGPIPEGLHVLHSCDVCRCVNPRHLSVGTQAMNMRQCRLKGRSNRGSINGRAKLTEDQVMEIINTPNETCAALGKKYGVHNSVISNIRIGKKWSHLTGIKYDPARS